MGRLPILPPGPRRASFERCSGERSSSRKWSSFLTLQCREGFGKFKDNLPPCILSLLPGQGAHALFDMEPHCGRVVPDHLLGEPQKVLTSEECRVSLEDGLRSPNSSRLGVYMRVCVCVCVCVCTCTDDTGSVLPKWPQGSFGGLLHRESPGYGEKRPHSQDKDF